MKINMKNSYFFNLTDKKLISRYAVFSLLLLGTGCQDAPARLQQKQRPIYGGEPVKNLFAVGSLSYKGKSFCSGTLIDQGVVLTAAHCTEKVVLEQDNPDSKEYSFDLVGRRGKALHYHLRKIYLHPQYERVLRHDVALIALVEKSETMPLPLRRSLSPIAVGQKLWLVGYGRDEKGISGTLRGVWMRLGSLNPNTLFLQGVKKSACYGDSGGPALVQDEHGQLSVVGLASYASPGCRDFVIYTRSDAYREFIDDVLASNASGKDLSAQKNHVPLELDSMDRSLAQGQCLNEEQGTFWDQLGRQWTMNCAPLGLKCLQGRCWEPCDSSTVASQGRCEEDTVVRCQEGKLLRLDCLTEKLQCQKDPLSGEADCRLIEACRYGGLNAFCDEQNPQLGYHCLGEGHGWLLRCEGSQRCQEKGWLAIGCGD
jgi:hypothetical protein